MKETLMIHEALNQLRKHTGINADIGKALQEGVDAKIEFLYNNKKYYAFVEAKKQLKTTQLDELIKLNKRYHPLIVITDYLYPKLKEELRNENIGYLETNGNLYFKHHDILLWLDGQKHKKDTKEKTGRAFTKTGLKLVFHFLLNEELLNLTYRTIAKKTGVGFGNINIIMNDLKQQGFLLQINKRQNRLANKKDLLQRWMFAYEEKLKPALKVGTFRFLKDDDFIHWKKIPLKNMKTLWGAEPAGDLLTDYLRPGELTMYTLEDKRELIKNYRLIPDEKGNVKVYQKFWNYDEVNDNIVPPLLVYIDLMNTNDRRCKETAQKIYEQLLQNKF